MIRSVDAPLARSVLSWPDWRSSSERLSATGVVAFPFNSNEPPLRTVRTGMPLAMRSLFAAAVLSRTK